MGDFDLVVGVYLLGLFLNTYLFGLVCYQFLVYKNTVFNDPLWIKSFVGVLFFLDTVHSVVEVYDAWQMCVTNYANPASLARVSWVIPFTAATTAVCALLAQSFLAHRVFILTKNKIIVAVIGILSLVGCVGGIVAGIKSGIISEVAKFGPLKPIVVGECLFNPHTNLSDLPLTQLGFQTAADLLITATLTFVLSRSRTGFRRTDHILNRLIRGAVQTGLFVTIFALGDLISFVVYNQTNMYAFFAFPLGRIYTNTMLDTLNSRQSIKAQLNSTVDMDSESNAAAFRMHSKKSQNRTGPAVNTFQSITVTKDVVSDGADIDVEDGKIKSSSAWYPQ
ncbi:hypothetical protein V5O48_005097 [Marasmius crinis-equi]|uniref:DUF6534 domain-containing protein n=1 Tax=Marasmius crinis-equi TaxID=585013 RepID=A0ABR3FNA6_9AGAR